MVAKGLVKTFSFVAGGRASRVRSEWMMAAFPMLPATQHTLSKALIAQLLASINFAAPATAERIAQARGAPARTQFAGQGHVVAHSNTATVAATRLVDTWCRQDFSA